MAKTPKHISATLITDFTNLNEWVRICMEGDYKFFINPTKKELVIFTNIDRLVSSIEDYEFSKFKEQVLFDSMVDVEADIYLSYQSVTFVEFEDDSDIPIHG